MKYEKRNCEECGREFIPKTKNQHGIQKFCSKKCKNKNYNKNRKKKNQLQPASTSFKKKDAGLKYQKSSLKQEVEVHQHIYNISNGNKIISQFKELAEKSINTMQIIKLEMYSESVKAVCIDIMKELYSFLQKQLKTEKDRGVIIVNSE